MHLAVAVTRPLSKFIIQYLPKSDFAVTAKGSGFSLDPFHVIYHRLRQTSSPSIPAKNALTISHHPIMDNPSIMQPPLHRRVAADRHFISVNKHPSRRYFAPLRLRRHLSHACSVKRFIQVKVNRIGGLVSGCTSVTPPTPCLRRQLAQTLLASLSYRRPTQIPRRSQVLWLRLSNLHYQLVKVFWGKICCTKILQQVTEVVKNFLLPPSSDNIAPLAYTPHPPSKRRRFR